MRKSEITRKTTETDISLSLELDGKGIGEIDTGIGFLDHMLELLARHGRFDLAIKCAGDVHVDGHHTVEDIGICLGSAFADAVGDARGITRYCDVTVPMDEALVLCAADVSGRGYLGLEAGLPPRAADAMQCIGAMKAAGTMRACGTFDAELLEEFLQAFVRKAGITLHIRVIEGKNAHHIIEACFKALARALRGAVKIDPDHGDEIPSTKGTLT